jgi:membrane-associated phospholipid phosphatase
VVLLVAGWWRRQRSWIAIVAAYIAAELVVAAGLVRLLKIVCGRPRPYLGAVDWSFFSLASGFHSLPSGHAADVMVGFAVVELVARNRWLKLAAGLVAVATMATRVLQGQHHLTDVVAGGLLGYLGGLVGVAMLRRWRS